MRVAVIGAGPSGLVTLKHLVSAHETLRCEPIDARLFEAEAEVGGTFRYRTYEAAELVSSKQLTTFSDFRPRSTDPDFLSAERYLEYLDAYCDNFKLWPRISLSTLVLCVSRRSGGGHQIKYRRAGAAAEEYWDCDAVAVCSGLHVTPNIPHLKGVDNVPVVMHSAQFKSRAQLGINKTVVILGSGETGMDLAYLAITGPTRRVILCHRDGFLCAPKRVPDPVILPILGNKSNPKRLNVPVDSSSASLFDSAYVHPRLRNHMALWHYYDIFIKSTLWLVSGTKHGLDQWVGGISEKRYHASKIFFNKSNLAMPYISAPYRAAGTASMVQRVRSSLIQIPIAETHGRQIDLAPWPSDVDKNGVMRFIDNKRPEYKMMAAPGNIVKPDVLLFATGYSQNFPFLDAEAYQTPGDGLVRDIWPAQDPTTGFIGFVRPAFGAIPPLAELQAQLWILQLVGQLRRPLDPGDEPQYRLCVPPTARIQYGLDHESYAYQMALDMDAAPGFWEVVAMSWNLRSLKLLLVWALGVNFNAKFRLRGPWKWDGAAAVLSEELWDTVERRGGFFGVVTLSILPMSIFGPLSLLFFLYDGMLSAIQALSDGLGSPQPAARKHV